MTISKRLGRLGKRRLDRWFAGACVLLIGGVIGGVFGYIAFVNTTPPPASHAKTEYVVVLVVAFVIGVVCGLAALAIREERDESIKAIKEDLDSLLKDHGPRATA
jgi:hypothetical protein